MRQPEEEKDPDDQQVPEGNPAEGAKGNDVSERLARLEKENEEHKRKINDLASEKATLEKRLSEREAPATTPRSGSEHAAEDDLEKDIATALEESITDPAKAGKKLADTIKRASTKAKAEAASEAVKVVDQNAEWNKHVERIRAENADIVKHEKRITQDAANLIRSGIVQDPKEALERAITDFRTEFGIKKPETSSNPPAGKPPAEEKKVPKGALGETGADSLPKRAPKVEDDGGDTETDAEYVARRKKLAAIRGV